MKQTICVFLNSLLSIVEIGIKEKVDLGSIQFCAFLLWVMLPLGIVLLRDQK